MNKPQSFCVLVLLICIIASIPLNIGKAQPTVVRAVLFYSPSCPHCQQVMTEHLPPLIEKYGDNLQILAVNTYTEGGQVLFESAVKAYQIETIGVPLLIIGDHVLIGSAEIPELFPRLVEQYLAAGGVNWPDFPGMTEAIAALPTSPPDPSAAPEDNTPEEMKTTYEPSQPPSTRPLIPTATFDQYATAAREPTLSSGFIDKDETNTNLSTKMQRDPVGNLLAVALLIGMAALVLFTFPLFVQRIGTPEIAARSWIFAILALGGLMIASYLAWVETHQMDAVCGPVGDCNAVQQSSYARLFGVLPIGIVGVLGYCAVLLMWISIRSAQPVWRKCGATTLQGITFFGVLFSIYLTFLEPFVIGAICAWCLSSAVIMSALYWLSIRIVAQPFSNLVSLQDDTSEEM